ncbi:hypothetical protein LTR95_000092 [Oleoguttula sp. CCFEE 5521]
MAVDDLDGLALMPLETPLLKVSRPVAACLRCRNAKVRCDGKLPACTSCERTGRAAECTSTNDQFARGKERSYVQTLETRIDKLQARLEEAHRRKPSVISLPDDDTGTAVPSRRQSLDAQRPEDEEPPTPNTSKAQRRKEASAIDDLVSGFGFLSVNATARDFYGFTSAMSYSRLILSACSKDPLPQGTTKALPPKHVATQLAQHYLNNVFQLIPVFDEASFYASVDSVYHRDTDKAQPVDHWMVRMVLAVASASLSERSGDQNFLEGIGHVCAALDFAEQVLHPGAISSVQALVLLVEYAMLDPHHFDSWSLIGAASRAMVDLGLHQDPPKGASMTKGKLELRRRVFWCVYALDRSTSLVQTRAFSFSDNSAKVKVPFVKQVASQPSSPEPQDVPAMTWLQSHQLALDLIGLRQIQSKWYTDLFQSGRKPWDEPYPYIWAVCNDMRKWMDGVSNSASPNMRAFFELDLLYSYVYVLSPSPRVPTITPFAQTLIFEYCIRYADLMQRLISDPSYTAPLSFYDAMRVYMTGRQFLDVLQQNLETLLNGIVPARPEVRPSSAPPPAIPQVMLPPGDTVQRFNTSRSINCIKQIIDCLARFGIRWGYMSWHQRYQQETSTMLEELTMRLRELEIMAGVRRPSMWQHANSTGSVGSNSSSQHFSSPHNSVQGQPVYQSPPPMQAHGISNYVDAGAAGQVSPPTYPPQAQQLYQQPGSGYSTSFPGQVSYSQAPMQPQPFAYGDPSASFHRPSISTAPHSQFGNWGGYSGPSVPDTLNEENAVPPLNADFSAELDGLFNEPANVDGVSRLLQSSGAAEMQSRRTSMHDAADMMLWETFHLPGPSPQPSMPPRSTRTSSTGLQLRQMDSNIPRTISLSGDKGKGRAERLQPGDLGFELWNTLHMPLEPLFDFDHRHNEAVASLVDGVATGPASSTVRHPISQHVAPLEVPSQQQGPSQIPPPPPSAVAPSAVQLRSADATEETCPTQTLGPSVQAAGAVAEPFPYPPQYAPHARPGEVKHRYAHPPPNLNVPYAGPNAPRPTQAQARMLPLQQHPHAHYAPPCQPQSQHAQTFRHPHAHYAPISGRPNAHLDPATQLTHAHAVPATHYTAANLADQTTLPTTTSGYVFRPGMGFVCRVCGSSVFMPGEHRDQRTGVLCKGFSGDGRWEYVAW